MAPIQFILVTVIRITHEIYHKIPVREFDIFVLFRVNTLLFFCKNVVISYNVSSYPPTPKHISCIHSMAMFFSEGMATNPAI